MYIFSDQPKVPDSANKVLKVNSFDMELFFFHDDLPNTSFVLLTSKLKYGWGFFNENAIKQRCTMSILV